VPFRNELRRGLAIAGLLSMVALVGGCTSEAHQATERTSTTSTSSPPSRTAAPLTAKSFSVEPCAGIVGSPTLQSNLNLEPMLLSAADLPSGATIDGPHRTSPTVIPTWASVPTEVIGDVGSPMLAEQLLAQLNSDLDGPMCTPSETVEIPGTNPTIAATLSGGDASSGGLRSERLFAAVGSRMICLTWTSQVQLDSSGLNPEPALPALPSTGTVAQVLGTALERLTS
jgi:hypothetical protein